MRSCPVCEHPARKKIFSMDYQVPDNWPLPDRISWYTCDKCGTIFGDGNFDQVLYDDYYKNYYGYGINGPDTLRQIAKDAAMIAEITSDKNACIIDFGGGGDDGKSLLEQELVERFGHWNVGCVGVGDTLPEDCDVIYASHVLEHIYDLPATMYAIEHALKADGLLIIDIPDSTGLLLHYKKPILDFNTKHLNHFTYRTMIYMCYRYGFELVDHNTYTRDGGDCVQFHFKHLDVARESGIHILQSTIDTLAKLAKIKKPVNVWGLNDRAWHILGKADLDVLDYIDNDPAMRGATYQGKQIQEQPRNDAPIVIIAQAQGKRLVENIRKAGWQNRILEL